MEFTSTIKQNYEFRRLYSKGKSCANAYLVVYCRKNGLDHNRLGLTASVKLGHAVVRNRARRRLREVYRLNGDKLAVGYDILVVARGRTVTASFQELTAAYLRLAKKLSLLKETP